MLLNRSWTTARQAGGRPLMLPQAGRIQRSLEKGQDGVVPAPLQPRLVKMLDVSNPTLLSSFFSNLVPQSYKKFSCLVPALILLIHHSDNLSSRTSPVLLLEMDLREWFNSTVGVLSKIYQPVDMITEFLTVNSCPTLGDLLCLVF